MKISQNQSALSGSWVAVAVTIIVGCGGGSDHAPTVPVTGTVKLNGQPVAGATVSFFGDSQVAMAISGDDGRFELTTFEEGDGAVEGTYRVTVVKMLSGGGDSGAGGDSMEAAAAAANSGDQAGGAKSVLAARYGDQNSSGLQFTVTKGEENDFTLELSP